MKVILRIVIPFIVTVLLIATVVFIVAAANFMPGWTIIPLGIPAVAAVADLLTE